MRKKYGIVQCTRICAEQLVVMESGRSSACRSGGLSRTTSGPSGIPNMSAIESADYCMRYRKSYRTLLMLKQEKWSIIITNYNEHNVEFC